MTSRFGKVLIAVRDTNRARGSRLPPGEAYKLFVFVLSAIMAGIGGALYVPPESASSIPASSHLPTQSRP